MAGSGLNADGEVMSESQNKYKLRKLSYEFECNVSNISYQYSRLVLGRMLDSLPIRVKIFEVFERAVVF